MKAQCDVVSSSDRNSYIDMYKGGGILMMIIVHCGLWHPVANALCTIHMPLFFIISGLLWKDTADFSQLVKKSAKKILLPYTATLLFVWLVKIIVDDNWMYGLGIVMGTTYCPVWGMDFCFVGPLWFLMSFFMARLLSWLLYHFVSNERIQDVIVIAAFELSLVYFHIYGMLPLGLLPAVAGSTFLHVGKRWDVFDTKNKWLATIGFIVWVVCALKGDTTMSAHVYRFHLLQIVAAIVSFKYFGLLLRKFTGTKVEMILSFIGRNSLAILCIHSIDRIFMVSMNFSSMISQYKEVNFCFAVVSSLLFVSIVYIILRKNNWIRNVYSIID